MKQLIIARKDLNMSPGKLAAQVSHASMAFLTTQIRENAQKRLIIGLFPFNMYESHIIFDADTYEGWIEGAFTKIVCEAKNKDRLLKSVEIAQSLGRVEGKDFFLIKDNCLTELEPEEIDENGVGRTLTCIGFKPLNDDMARKISKKYQIYK